MTPALIRSSKTLIVVVFFCGVFPLIVFPAQTRFTVSDAASSLWVPSESEAQSRATGAAIQKLRISCQFEGKAPKAVKVELAGYSVQKLTCNQAYQNERLLHSCKAETKGVCEFTLGLTQQ
jgi:hypothetical protein